MKKSSSSQKKAEKVSSTLKLARHLGLSEWTVSRAINGHPEVKTATRERILKAMDEIGFRPNPVARGLSGKAMGMVGVCFGHARNALMMDKITLLDEFLREHQLRGVLAISPPDEESQIRILNDFKHLRLDGIVLIQSYINTAKLRLILEGVKCVHVDSPDPRITPSVTLNRDRAMELTINHLVDLGHRSFGTFGFSSSSGALRWDGMVEALVARGINPEKAVKSFILPAPAQESSAEGIELAKLACRDKRLPTALIAINDRVAVGVMQELRDRGFNFPNDLSMVGFDNLDVGQYLRPRLTTIDQQPHVLMKEAGELLLTQLGIRSGTDQESSVIIAPHLIVRESTGPAPK